MSEWSPTAKARAQEVLARLIPRFRNADHVLDNLYFVDPDNDSTRIPSIAAALCVLGLWPGIRPMSDPPQRPIAPENRVIKEGARPTR